MLGLKIWSQIFVLIILQEIVRQMREGRRDIQADPVLYKACANDVKRHCSDIPFGKGKGKNKQDCKQTQGLFTWRWGTTTIM